MITVQELIDTSSLGLTAIAGLSGGPRKISWAHAVDLPDPWRWIAPGNLVMTTGMGLPRLPQQQVDWLEQLAQSHASALVVARQPEAPELSSAMLEAADRLMFPVLAASFELEFVKLSRHVIESVLQAQRDRFRASEQLFQTYATALRDRPDMAGRLALLAERLHLGLDIEDAASGALIVSSSPQGGGDAQAAFVERVAIAGRARANLVMHRRDRNTLLDPLLVRSLLGLLEVELERLMIERDALREEGAALLRSLLQGETEFTLVRPLLERRGLTGTLVSLAICPGPQGHWSLADLHHAPGLHARAPLLLPQDDALLALAEDAPPLLQALGAHLGTGTVIGVSGPITAATGLRESVRQARLALAQARENEAPVLRYGEFETALIMAPRSLAEARALIGRYLGPLIEYDRTHGSALLQTLTRFLGNDGNWKSTAFDLGIHRQTLVYRLKLIEQLSGFKPTTTDGAARFWLALQAGKAAQLFPQ